MKKQQFIHLMLTGVTAGLLISPQFRHLAAEEKKELGGKTDENFMKLVEETGGNITYHKMTEEELLLELNQESSNIYYSLSPEGKELALKIASRSCNNTNDCKGENACRTNQNSCAGQGQCKGQTKCAFSDKNLAVKVAAKKMASKRQEALQGTPSSNQTENHNLNSHKT